MEGAIFVGVAILWLACGFGCAAIASRKNRSAFVWFWLGLILGIIGILIIGFMKAKDKPVRTLSKSPMYKLGKAFSKYFISK